MKGNRKCGLRAGPRALVASVTRSDLRRCLRSLRSGVVYVILLCAAWLPNLAVPSSPRPSRPRNWVSSLLEVWAGETATPRCDSGRPSARTGASLTPKAPPRTLWPARAGGGEGQGGLGYGPTSSRPRLRGAYPPPSPSPSRGNGISPLSSRSPLVTGSPACLNVPPKEASLGTLSSVRRRRRARRYPHCGGHQGGEGHRGASVKAAVAGPIKGRARRRPVKDRGVGPERPLRTKFRGHWLASGPSALGPTHAVSTEASPFYTTLFTSAHRLYKEK